MNAYCRNSNICLPGGQTQASPTSLTVLARGVAAPTTRSRAANLASSDASRYVRRPVAIRLSTHRAPNSHCTRSFLVDVISMLVETSHTVNHIVRTGASSSRRTHHMTADRARLGEKPLALARDGSAGPRSRLGTERRCLGSLRLRSVRRAPLRTRRTRTRPKGAEPTAYNMYHRYVTCLRVLTQSKFVIFIPSSVFV